MGGADLRGSTEPCSVQDSDRPGGLSCLLCVLSGRWCALRWDGRRNRVVMCQSKNRKRKLCRYLSINHLSYPTVDTAANSFKAEVISFAQFEGFAVL